MAKSQLLPYTPEKKLTIQKLPSTPGKKLTTQQLPGTIGNKLTPQTLGVSKAVSQNSNQSGYVPSKTASTTQSKTVSATPSTRLDINSLTKEINKQKQIPAGVVNKQNQAGVNAQIPTQFNMDAFLSEMQRQNQASINAQNQQQSEIEARINALNQAKQAQAIADFGRARDTQLSNLTGEESSIKPVYYDKRNQSAASNIMGRRTLAEELAARGEARSGVADEANIRANMSLQGETGSLNRQEAADITDIARRRTGVQNTYTSDVASAKAGLEAASMQNLIDQYNADRQFKLQEAGLTGTYSGNQTLAAQGQSFNQGMATQQFNEAKSQQEIDNVFRQTQTDIQNQLNNRQITNQEAQQLLDNAYRSKTLAEQKRQFNVGQTNYEQQAAQSNKQQTLDNLYRQQTFDYQKSRDAVSDTQWQKAINLDLRQQSFNEAQSQIENAFTKGQMARADADQALQWAKFNADNDPNSLDNQIKKAQIDSMSGKTNTNTTATVDDYASTINSLFVVKPSSSNGYQSSIDTTGIQTYIDNLIASGVDRDTINSLSARYGLK